MEVIYTVPAKNKKVKVKGLNIIKRGNVHVYLKTGESFHMGWQDFKAELTHAQKKAIKEMSQIVIDNAEPTATTTGDF